MSRKAIVVLIALIFFAIFTQTCSFFTFDIKSNAVAFNTKFTIMMITEYIAIFAI